jgi:ligand-binding sensor domain-containing protein
MRNFFIILFLLTVLVQPLNFSQTISEPDFSVFLEGAYISGICEEESFLWVSTYGHGIFSFSKKDGKWFNFSTKNRNLDNDLFHAIAVSKDFVWAAANEGLYIYDKKKNRWSTKKFALGGEFGNWIRSLYYDKNQNVLWIGRFRNLTQLEVAKQKYTDFELTQGNDPKSNTFKSIKADGDSLIWFGTESGVHIYRKNKKNGEETWQFINNKKGFKQEGDAVSISDFAFEKDYVWFGTDEFVTQQQPQFNLGGIYRYNRKFIWDKFSKETGLPGSGVYCLERTGNTIWAGLYSFDKKGKKEYGKGLVMIDRISGRIIPVNLNLLQTSSSTITKLYFDGNDLWIGTDKGLWRISITNPLAAWDLKKPQGKGKTKK